MEINKLREPLNIKQIDFRIQSINKGGYATILAYKDARVDMNRLDEVVGPFNWKKEYSRDNRNCTVYIFDEGKMQWISKEDTGTESNTEQEKGLASDSFKRACFNWGIGRELYDYPQIQIKLNSNEFELYDTGSKDRKGNPIMKAKATWDLNIAKWKWASEFIGDKIVALACKDERGSLRFKWGEFSTNK